MAKKKKKHKKPGPKGPMIDIDWKEFDNLCRIQSTQEEMACWFNCSVDTIDRAVKREKKMNFAEYYRKKRGTGKVSLRRVMWQTALRGDKTMCIWLSKNHLGMQDAPTPDADKNVQKLLYSIEELNKKHDK